VRAPLALPAVYALAGTWASRYLIGVSVPGLVALVALLLAFGGRHRSVALLPTGLLWGMLFWSPAPDALPGFDASRPVTLEGVTAGCWSPSRDGWEARVRLRSVAQGNRVFLVGWKLRMHIPGAEPPPPCGAGVRARGYLSGPREYLNTPPLRVGGWGIYLKSRRLFEETDPPRLVGRAATLLRARVGLPGAGDAQEAGGEAPGRLLVRALLYGEAHALPPRWQEGFRRAGLAHLLAVSGLHVGMVAGAVLLLTLKAPRELRIVAALVACSAYALLVGPRPSLLRALLMATLGGAALLLRRPPQPLNALGAATLMLLVDDPAWVGELGFQLSVAATAGILILAPSLMRWLSLLPPALATSLAVTLAAQLATLPWSLAAFHRFCPLAPVANLVAIPWAALALTSCLLWALLRVALPAAAVSLERALDLLALPAELLASVPPTPLWSVPVVSSWAIAVLATGLLASVVLYPGRAWQWGGRLVVALLLTSWPYSAGPPRGAVELVLLDVGQGDGILLRDGRETLLLDAGGWSGPGFGTRVVRPALAGLGLRRVDVLAVSHAHRDHCGGIADLAREIPARELWAADRLEGSSCGEELTAVRRLTWRILEPGEVATLGRWRLVVLGPPAGAGPAPNDRSLVLRAEALGRSVLLTGDTEALGERLLLQEWRDELASDILKVGHHGSRTSTSPAFLAAASPRWALIPVGRGNRYGHPAPEVLETLHRQRVPVLRTDHHGMIRISWTGPEGWRIETQGPRGRFLPRRKP
jgi:competence protein ComEC